MKDLKVGLANINMPGTGRLAERLTDQELFAVYLRMGRNDDSAWGKELARRRITRDGLLLDPEGYAAYSRIEALGKAQAAKPLDCPSGCPRCGRPSMKPQLYTNALSRYAHIYICDICGMDEAVRGQPGHPKGVMPFQDWSIEDHAKK